MFVDVKVAQYMGVPFPEIDQVPEHTYMVALECMNAENRAEQHLRDLEQMKAKRASRK